jgi:hypothetical protein
MFGSIGLVVVEIKHQTVCTFAGSLLVAVSDLTHSTSNCSGTGWVKAAVGAVIYIASGTWFTPKL